ncbi:hypothetical protein TOT_020000005 [Theileria orientalis strain Shintoku]|uniref:Uncharacterized protein n=1 Tax=Theileria orientalis strain Shintoku TaxID=869250 RepID=J4CCP1_THEOR|nr:hypothetical protein TOT_020000005 [Theileria orientalis strain Shintoku]BAM39732.1 hypothetical protein TOT_020000005 [Theileria orientalis strain Shintoku]|eukprot:XP_009690033.1 hypothetical protein TOT_020000005 [Theileria orientalis strain Shintoku]
MCTSRRLLLIHLIDYNLCIIFGILFNLLNYEAKEHKLNVVHV